MTLTPSALVFGGCSNGRNNMENFDNKLEAFRQLVEADQLAEYRRTHEGMTINPETEKHETRTYSLAGRKYAKVDVRGSGKYMVEVSTGNIFGIKAYGQVHKGHFYGTLDTIAEWFWGDYYPHKKDGSSRCQKANGCPAMTYAPAVAQV